MRAAIRLPNTCDAIKNAQKYPKKKPLLLSLAHSATYLPYATHSNPAPNPLTAEENSESTSINLRLNIIDELSLCSGYNAAGRKHKIQNELQTPLKNREALSPS